MPDIDPASGLPIYDQHLLIPRSSTTHFYCGTPRSDVEPEPIDINEETGWVTTTIHVPRWCRTCFPND